MLGFLKSRRHAAAIVLAVQQAAHEGERVYRAQLEALEARLGPINPSPLGMLKARAQIVSFPVFAFAHRWSDQKKRRAQVLTSAFQQCLVGLATHEDGRQMFQIASATLGRTTKLILEDLAEGPSVPGGMGLDPSTVLDAAPYLGVGDAEIAETMEFLGSNPKESTTTKAFQGLVQMAHEALADSIGQPTYDREARRSMEPILAGNMFVNLRGMVELFTAMV